MKRIRTSFALLLSLVLALACSGSGPIRDRVRAAREAEAPFPPVGPVSLAPQPAPADGALFQLVMVYEGRTETSFSGARAHEDPQSANELLQMEVDYRQMPVAASSEEDLASSLLLDALRRRLQVSPPGSLHTIEAGDDRIRTGRNEKIDTDLRGAQPKGDMTPRSVLNKPFALLVTDRRGVSKGVTLRGIPSVKKMLASLPVREAISYVQVARPEGPVSPGATWTGKRFMASSIGRLGVSVEVEYRLVGFEKIDDVPCAHVSLRGQRDEANAPSELGLGLVFEQIRVEYGGDAWIELETGLVRLMRVEDIAAISYERKGVGSVGAKVRSRYETRASLQLLDVKTTTAKWADGTKRFADVK